MVVVVVVVVVEAIVIVVVVVVVVVVVAGVAVATINFIKHLFINPIPPLMGGPFAIIKYDAFT